MAFGVDERPERSPAAILQSIDFPATRDALVLTAEDSDSPVEVINFLKSLPDRLYLSADDCLREFAEADARAGMGPGREVHHRGDIGKEMTEPREGPPRHP